MPVYLVALVYVIASAAQARRMNLLEHSPSRGLGWYSHLDPAAEESCRERCRLKKDQAISAARPHQGLYRNTRCSSCHKRHRVILSVCSSSRVQSVGFCMCSTLAPGFVCKSTDVACLSSTSAHLELHMTHVWCQEHVLQ